MIKIAFFVEGKTERIFVEKYLNIVYSHPHFNIDSYEIRGGRIKIITKLNYNNESIDYYFLIFDVGGDGSVNSALLERSKKLINQNGYRHIFGIRDLFPLKPFQLSSIKSNFFRFIDDESILNAITLIIAVMEIEAWFLADYPFFQRMDSRLTPTRINNALAIDIENDNIEAYRHPAKIIDDIYRLIGKRYKKRESNAHSICSYIDFNDLYLNEAKRARIPSFNSFVQKLDEIS